MHLKLKHKKGPIQIGPFKHIEVKLKAERIYFRYIYCDCLAFERSPILYIKGNRIVIVDSYISWLSKFSTRVRVVFQDSEVS